MAKVRVAAVTDIQPGRLHQVSAGDHTLILVVFEDRIHALGGTCPHHGAPLADGTLDHDRVLCPWHQSVFRIADGSVLEPPALDNLPRFEVEIDGDDVLVDVPSSAPSSVQPDVAHGDRAADGRTVVILGGGAAGLAAAQELRLARFEGRIVMVSDDAHRRTTAPSAPRAIWPDRFRPTISPSSRPRFTPTPTSNWSSTGSTRSTWPTVGSTYRAARPSRPTGCCWPPGACPEGSMSREQNWMVCRTCAAEPIATTSPRSRPTPAGPR